MRPLSIVVLPPGSDIPSGIFQRQEPVLVEAFLSEASIEGFDEGIVGGLPPPAEIKLNSVQICPLAQHPSAIRCRVYLRLTQKGELAPNYVWHRPLRMYYRPHEWEAEGFTMYGRLVDGA